MLNSHRLRSGVTLRKHGSIGKKGNALEESIISIQHQVNCITLEYYWMLFEAHWVMKKSGLLMAFSTQHSIKHAMNLDSLMMTKNGVKLYNKLPFGLHHHSWEIFSLLWSSSVKLQIRCRFGWNIGSVCQRISVTICRAYSIYNIIIYQKNA